MSTVVTLGEAMIRLAPPHFQRLEQARALDLEIGGAELNTAAGLARLGHDVAWVSRLADNPLGRLIVNRVREADVSDRWVQFAPGERCGLYFLEFGAAPRASSVLYDRADSAAAHIRRGQFDWPSVFAGAKWFHVTGITAALGPGVADAVSDALHAAKVLGLTTSVDLNYRSKLWSAADAGRTMGELLRSCDVLFASEADAAHLFGVTGVNFADVAGKLIDRFGLTGVFGTKRETPLVWRNRFGAVGFMHGSYHESPWYDVEIVDRLGTGDALAAGVIHGLLAGDFAAAVGYGAALGALKHTTPGDLPWFDRAEVDAVLAGTGLRIQR